MGLGFLSCQPHRATPHTGRAQRHSGRHLATPPDPSGSEYRHRGHRIDDLGDQDHGGDLACMAPRLVALGDDQVHASVHVPLGMGPGAGQGGHWHARLVAAVDHLGRWGAQRVSHKSRPVGQGDVDLAGCPVGRERRVGRAAGQPAERLLVDGLVGRDVVAIKQFVKELPVLVGDHGHNVDHLQPALAVAGVPGRDDQVDPVGAVADLVFDPVQVHLEGLVAMAYSPEDAQAAGSGDGGHHIAAVAEGQDRELDTEHVGDRGLHLGAPRQTRTVPSGANSAGWPACSLTIIALSRSGSVVRPQVRASPGVRRATSAHSGEPARSWITE